MRIIRASLVACTLLFTGAGAAWAQTSGSISGVVTDANGAPVSGRWIYAYSASSDAYYTGASTNAAGLFVFPSLPPNTYYLMTDINFFGTYVPQIYGTSCPVWRCTYRDGAPIALAASQSVTGIDFVLRTGGSVAGSLFDAATSSPVPTNTSATALLFDESGHYIRSASIYSSSNGYLFEHLPAGDYHLLIQASTYTGYISELGDGRHCPLGCAIAAGTPFRIADGMMTTLNVSLDRLSRITGRLINEATGQTITSGSVTVRSIDGQFSSSAYTQSPYYEYEALVPPGTYTVMGLASFGFVPEFFGGIQAVCNTETWQGDPCAGVRRMAAVVEVTTGATRSGIDIRLNSGGSIAGGITVAGPLSTSTRLKVLTPGGLIVRDSYVSAPGTYQVPNLPPGVYYLCVGDDGRDFRPQAYGGLEFPGQSCPAAAGTPVTVTAGVPTTSINFTLQLVRPVGSQIGTIRGTARNALGQPLTGRVGVYRDDGSSWNSVLVASDGTYSIAVSPGAYFLKTESYDNLIDEWYGGVCAVCGDSRGTLLTLEAGATLSGIDFELAPGASIQGTVSPIAMPVAAYDATGRRVQSGFGSPYTISKLPPGTYYVRTVSSPSPGWVNAIHPNVPCPSDSCPVQAGAPVAVVAGQTMTNINITVVRGGIVRGRAILRNAVVDVNGALRVPTVEAVDARGAAAGTWIGFSNGYYEIRGLPPGTYYVRTIDGQDFGVINQTWQAIQCAACPVTDGTPVPVLEDRYTEGIDFALEAGGAITGLVVESGNGTPLDNQRVEVRAASGELIGSGLTTLNGSYVVEGLPEGSYFVQTAASTGYLDQRYHGVACVACAPGEGLPVAVASRSTVPGINFALVRGGRVAGRITAGTQVGLANVTVSLVDASGTLVGRALSGAGGGFVASAPIGLVYAKTEPLGGYLSQAFDRQACPGGNCNLATAAPLTVQLGQMRSGVDFALTSCSAFAILPAVLPTSLVSYPYATTLGAAGGTGSHQFSVVGGSLPPGVSLAASNGALTGTLTQPGSYRFTVGATDTLGCGAQHTYHLEVKGCAVSLSAEYLSFPSGGGQTAVLVVGGCPWQASTPESWITVTQGTGAVAIAVAPNPGVTRYGRVTIGGRSVAIAQASLTSGLPFGNLDVPLDGVTVRGSIAVGGWALDDVQVTRVVISRDAVAPEPAGQPIYIGDAVRVRGARPDVEAFFPTHPEKDKAGWGFLLLTNMLPGQGNGVFRLHAHAIDFEGNQRLLGSRTIVAANATATMPFGAIDTPGQGETISGSAYINFGWALTPLSKTIPPNGSTITVFVDGVAVGTVDYGHFRSDVATLFPGLNNSNGAVGFRMLNTTQLANGIHTISWVVSDDSGATEGIGSRYFHVNNTTAPVSGFQSDAVASETVEASAASIVPRGDARRVVRIREMERLTLDLAPAIKTVFECRSSFAGFEVVGDERRPLPAGSTLDPSTGAFAWQPGPGFIGSYQLLFVATCNGEGTALPVEVRIVRALR